jgi:pimeloyl-ACP methyl ester carboxylesterase
MGDVGRSVQRVGFRDAADIARWLDETLEGLGLASAHLVGNSYGAWLALNLVRRARGRARSLSLLDPAGMAKLSFRAFVWAFQTFAAAFLPAPLRRRAATRLRMQLLEDKRTVRMLFHGVRNHPFRLPIENLSDEDLRSIAVPTLLLMGAKSEIYRAPKVLARAQALMRDLDAAILPGVGHSLPIDPKANAGTLVDQFLTRVCHASITPRAADDEL